LAREKELVGFYVSGHPLDTHRDLVDLFAKRANTSNLGARRDQRVSVACVVTEITRRISRKDGAEWARLVFEDYYGTAVALAFRDVWAKHRDQLEPGTPVLLLGSVSGRERDEENPPLFLNGVAPLESVYESGRVAICLELENGSEVDRESLSEAVRIARDHPGPAALQVKLRNSGEEPSRLRSRAVSVAPQPELLERLRATLGRERVRLVEVYSQPDSATFR
jgi:DNA polymerase-3 subunit alpha